MKSIALYYSKIEHASDTLDNTSSTNDEIKIEEDKESTETREKKKVFVGLLPDIVDLHINIWKIKRGILNIKSELYFDFGIKTTFATKRLCLYLPFKVSQIEDLGSRIFHNKELLNTIFNDDLLLENQPNDCFCKIKNAQPTDFYLYQLGSENLTSDETQEKDEPNGTFIKILLEGYPDDKWEPKEKEHLDEALYVRFRVKVGDKKDVVITQNVSNDLFQSAFSMVDLYDIRINELRELHPKIIEKMKHEKYEKCTFNKIHIFYMADTREKIENGSSLQQDSRILEERKWSAYEPHTALNKPIFIAHHWKNSANYEQLKSFNLFFSTIYPDTQLIKVTVYIMTVIILGWAGSMLSLSSSTEDSSYNHIKIIIIGIALFVILLYLIISYIGFKPGKFFRKK